MKKRFEKVNAVVRTTAALLLTFSLGLLGCELEPQPVPVVRVSGVEVVGDSTVALKVGKMGQLSWKVIPENAANKNVVLESSNPEIVTVDGSGVLDALKAGTATVTVKTVEGEFTASWTINVASNTKTVTFNYGYDGKEPAKKDVVEGEKVQRPANNPEREGFEFVNWYSGEAVYDFESAVNEDITLTAKWLALYTVTFDENGAANKVPSQTVKEGEKYTKPADPVKEGSKFAGWFAAEATAAFDFDAVPAASVALTAKWELLKYKVTFDTDGGSAIPAVEVEYGNTIVQPANPTKDGLHFGGWKNGDADFSFGTAIKSDITLKAVWSADAVYTVTVNANYEGAPAPTTVQAIKANGYKITAPVAERTGYTLAGWTTDAAGETAFDFNTVISADTTIYAKWTLNKFKVTFNTDGGSELAAVEVEYGKTVTPAATTKTGYTFVKWQIDDRDYDLTTPVTKDITLKAVWKINEYKVTFDVDGGSAVEAQYVKYGTPATKPADPTKVGYTFSGWKNGDADYNFESAVTGNITLKAVWKLNAYTVTFMYEEKQVKSETVNHNEKVARPVIADTEIPAGKKGFWTFCSDAALATPFDFASNITAATTVYVKFNEITGVAVNANGWTRQYDALEIPFASSVDIAKQRSLTLNLKAYDINGKDITADLTQGNYVFFNLLSKLTKDKADGENISVDTGNHYGMVGENTWTVGAYTGTVGAIAIQNGRTEVAFVEVTKLEWTEKSTTATVSFVCAGIDNIATAQEVEVNAKASRPTIADAKIPAGKKGFWTFCADEALTTSYDFETVITEAKTIYVKFNEISGTEVIVNSNPMMTQYSEQMYKVFETPLAKDSYKSFKINITSYDINGNVVPNGEWDLKTMRSATAGIYGTVDGNDNKIEDFNNNTTIKIGDVPVAGFSIMKLKTDAAVYFAITSIELVPADPPAPPKTYAPGELKLVATNKLGDGALKDGLTENSDGSLTINPTCQYGGGGVLFYVNDDKSGFALTDYVGLDVEFEYEAKKWTVTDAPSFAVSVCETGTTYWSPKAIKTAYPKGYGKKGKVALRIDISDIQVKTCESILIKLQSPSSSEEDDYVEMKITSLKFEKTKNLIPAIGEVALTNENIIATGSTPYGYKLFEGKDNSISFNATCEYGGGGVAFYINLDKSIFNITNYKKLNIEFEYFKNTWSAKDESGNEKAPSFAVTLCGKAATESYYSLDGKKTWYPADYARTNSISFSEDISGITEKEMLGVLVKVNPPEGAEASDSLTIKIKSIKFEQ